MPTCKCKYPTSRKRTWTWYLCAIIEDISVFNTYYFTNHAPTLAVGTQTRQAGRYRIFTVWLVYILWLIINEHYFVDGDGHVSIVSRLSDIINTVRPEYVAMSWVMSLPVGSSCMFHCGRHAVRPLELRRLYTHTQTHSSIYFWYVLDTTYLVIPPPQPPLKENH